MFILFYFPFVHYTGVYQVGIRYDKIDGSMNLDSNQGFHISHPFVLVTKVDTLPLRVCVSSTTKTVHCKLVRFIPENYKEFVMREGFYYYWWSNRLSFNPGYSEHYRGFRDKLKGYAFAHSDYSFIEIIESFHE